MKLENLRIAVQTRSRELNYLRRSVGVGGGSAATFKAWMEALRKRDCNHYDCCVRNLLGVVDQEGTFNQSGFFSNWLALEPLEARSAGLSLIGYINCMLI